MTTVFPYSEEKKNKILIDMDNNYIIPLWVKLQTFSLSFEVFHLTTLSSEAVL